MRRMISPSKLNKILDNLEMLNKEVNDITLI